MTSLAPLPWQQALWAQQSKSLREGRLPHALLIHGPRGSGKAHFARALAQLALCKNPEQHACGHCSSCRIFASGSQADWIEVRRAEDKKDILIDQVRSFCAAIQLTANGKAGRFALIHEADRLNRAAANALLKTLEEPPAGAHIFLIAEQLSRLPATIRSRCSRISMPRPDIAQARDWLGSEFSQVPDELIQRIGPVELKQSADQLDSFLVQQRNWGDTLDQLKHSQDPLKAASEISDDQFDAFLSWWQRQLLQGMKASQQSVAFKRLWDALLRVRRQGQGSSINRLLALEGLFILYTELLLQART